MSKTDYTKVAGVQTAPAFLTIAELRQRWRCSEMFLHRMRKANRLRAYKIGAAAVRFAMADVLRFEQEAAA